MLTRDNLLINCNTIYSYRYDVPELATFKVKDASGMVQFTMKGIIKSLVAFRTFEELQKNAEEFNKALQDELQIKINPYGIVMTSVAIKDVFLNAVMQKAMAQTITA